MYINKISIEGYKNFSKKSEIVFRNGLNVLVGENGTGKSSIIDAFRLLLAEDEYGRMGIRDTDFHKPFKEKTTVADFMQIQATISGMEEEEKVAFLPWLVDEDQACLTLRVENRLLAFDRYKRILWGGVSVDSMFEPELFEAIQCIYLPPLRDAEAKLRAGRNSRIARLMINLNKQTLEEAKNQNQLHSLEKRVKDFNDSLVSSEDDSIARADQLIQERLTQALGQVFSQSTSIQFSSVQFRRIVEGLRLLFFPEFGGNDNKELYRSLEENSLGYNNILYLATVLAELSIETIEKGFLKVLLIEEPEAHLHPQLQIRLLKYLEEQANNRNIQIVVTTHSPVLASSASLDSIIHLSKIENKTIAVQIRNCGLSNTSSQFLSRWLDVTKSTLFFAKGVIFVEGIAEAMLISELAHRVLKDYNEQLSDKDNMLPEQLSDAGISIINMGGIYFKYFLQLFCNLTEDSDVENIPVRCAGISDKDPLPIDCKPTPENSFKGENPAIKLIDKVFLSKNCKLFISPFKTFEYDLAMHHENLRVMLQFADFNPEDKILKEKIDQYKKQEWSEDMKKDNASKADISFYLLGHIDKGIFSQWLAIKLTEESEISFIIPEYIKKAVLWVVGGIND